MIIQILQSSCWAWKKENSIFPYHGYDNATRDGNMAFQITITAVPVRRLRWESLPVDFMIDSRTQSPFDKAASIDDVDSAYHCAEIALR